MLDNFEKLWKDALFEIEPNVSKANFSTWFKDTYISKYEDGVVTINVPNDFVKEWLSTKYYKFVISSLRNLNPQHSPCRLFNSLKTSSINNTDRKETTP